MMLGRWGDDGPVYKDNNWLWSIERLKVLLDESTDLLESSKRSVWDSNEEVLTFLTISLLVGDSLDAVDKNDAKVSFE